MTLPSPTPVCTFVVSAFNRPVELKLCLLSLVCQSRVDWSAIVTDNAMDSTYRDLNRDAVEWVGDPRIQYAYTGDQAKNCYISANIGAQEAEGEWLAFPSDDGYVCPWYLERMLRRAADLDLVYCDIVLGSAQSHRFLSQQPRCCEIDKTGFSVRREWFNRVGGFVIENVDGGASTADGQFIERVVAAGARHGKVDEVLVVHN